MQKCLAVLFDCYIFCSFFYIKAVFKQQITLAILNVSASSSVGGALYLKSKLNEEEIK